MKDIILIHESALLDWIPADPDFNLSIFDIRCLQNDEEFFVLSRIEFPKLIFLDLDRLKLPIDGFMRGMNALSSEMGVSSYLVVGVMSPAKTPQTDLFFEAGLHRVFKRPLEGAAIHQYLFSTLGRTPRKFQRKELLEVIRVSHGDETLLLLGKVLNQECIEVAEVNNFPVGRNVQCDFSGTCLGPIKLWCRCTRTDEGVLLLRFLEDNESLKETIRRLPERKIIPALHDAGNIPLAIPERVRMLKFDPSNLLLNLRKWLQSEESAPPLWEAELSGLSDFTRKKILEESDTDIAQAMALKSFLSVQLLSWRLVALNFQIDLGILGKNLLCHEELVGQLGQKLQETNLERHGAHPAQIIEVTRLKTELQGLVLSIRKAMALHAKLMPLRRRYPGDFSPAFFWKRPLALLLRGKAATVPRLRAGPKKNGLVVETTSPSFGSRN